MSIRQLDAWEEGLNACFAFNGDDPEEHIPYDEDTFKGRCWMRGWAEGCSQLREKKKSST